ncbi:MFS transporter [Streptomyces sp. Ru72]|uniref:MFS transporter n=1 Tax=Streptomyces sp. Ru72 TaxID=2080747 RepID=UPI000CDDCF90|nr:MFS transporter [Streptomyces sp. Ru72]POX52584.1 MFS transporter [Streptomyces sp. Ru72]
MEFIQTEAAPATDSGRAHHHAQPKHRWWALGVIALAQLMVVLDATIVNIALPSAQQDLGFDNNGRQWIVTAYSLAFGSLLLLGGRLADLFGRKTTFIIGLVGFAAASALGGAANGFTMLVVARAVQGLFGALLAPAALSLLTTTFTDAKERARAFGVFGAIAGSGAAVGLVLGGLLTEYLNWRWTLYVNDVIAVFALIGAIVFISRSVPAQRPRLDIPGVILVSGGLFGVVYGFANAETHHWSNWMTWGFLVAGGVLLLAFFLWQARAKHPLLPLRVLADRNRGAALSTVLISSAGMFGVFLFLTYYLQATLGYSPVKNGVAFLPMVGALMVMAQLSTNVLVPKVGPKVIVPIGMLLAAGGMVWLTRLGLHSGYAAHVLPPLLLIGAGLGLSMPAAMSYATLGVQASDQGVASAAVNTTQQVGGSVSTALLNTLATSAATDYAKHHMTDPLVKANAALHSYSTAYWWSAGFFAFAVLVTALLFRRRATPQPAADTPAAPAPGAAPAAPEPLAVATAGDTDGRDTARPDIEIDGPGVIRGQVRDGAGTPLARAAITVLDPTGRQVARATSREDGSYAVDTSARGSLVLIGSAAGHQPQVATLSLNGTPIAYDLVMPAGTGTVSGTVRDTGGEALPAALVVVTDERGAVASSTTTGTDGAYRVADLLPGDYAVTVTAAGRRPAASLVTVTTEGIHHDIELRAAVDVRGTIRTRDGRTVEDARVTLLDAEGNVVAARSTGPDGTYAFTDLSGDEYTVVASGYPPVVTPVKIDGGGRRQVDVSLGHEEA